jgi:predicted DNA-binding transcriptional regulator AlpA
VTGPQIKTVFGRSKEPTPEAPPARRILTIKDLPNKGISYHPNHLRRMWRQNKFPKPFYPSDRRPSWLEETIDEWINIKIAEAKQAAGVQLHERQDEVA